jgi:hypothetical protein
MARRHLAGVVGLAAAVGLAACVEREPQAPMRPEFAVQSGQCSFNTAGQLAGSYFTNNTTAQTARALIGDMRQAGAGTTTAREAGFDVFALMSANIAVNPDVQTGSALVNALVACMYTDAAELPLAFPEDFTTALDANQNGAFAVRGGAFDDTGVVYARINRFSGVYPVGGDWIASLDSNPEPRRVLFYGRPGTSLYRYDWRMFPHNATFSPPLIVGLCVDPFVDDRLMVQKSNEEGVGYLAFQDAAFLDPNDAFTPGDTTDNCGPTSAAMGGFWSPRLLAGRLFQLGLDLLSPKPLSASTMLWPGGLGGTTGGLRTEYGPEVVDTVTLTFLTQPHDARVCLTASCSGRQNIGTIRILATKDGDPVGGVSVDLEAINNNGVTVVLQGTHPLVTGEDGTVTFTDLGLNKTGGYKLLTVAELVVARSQEIVIPSVTSKKFNIRP